MTSTPVRYVPQPYPVEYAQQYATTFGHKENVIFIAGRTDRENITKGLHVARRLQQQFPNHQIHLTEIDEPDVELNTAPLEGTNFQVIQFQPWHDYLQYIARVKLVINTDYTQTRGRVQADCAAVGTPSIGADSDAQADLFPDLPAAPDTPIDDLVQQGKQLLNDPGYYLSIMKTAHDQLQKYSYEESAKRIKDLVKGLP